MWSSLALVILLVAPARQQYSNFDIEDIIRLSEVQNIRLVGAPRCYVSGPFVLSVALEIAHHLLTFRPRTFSVQEFVDCHGNGCYEGDIKEYVDWLIVNDRLAPAPQYVNYRAEPFTCRAGTAPDGLDKIRVTGLRQIQVQDFQLELLTYGSVISCIDTSTENCFTYRQYRDGIIDGYPSLTCHERVLIVGYTQEYYRVRSTNGAAWGENGYFRILRGGNRCGIEAALYVLETSPRAAKPGISPLTGCPDQYPVYCDVTKTCRGLHQECVTAVLSDLEKARREEDRVRKRPNSYNYPSRRKRDAVSLCGDTPGYPCETVQKYCGYDKVRVNCGATCGMCREDGTPRCRDQGDYPAECRTFRRYCSLVPAVRIKCPWTCKVDPRDCEPQVLEMIRTVVRYNPPASGPCYLPAVVRGRVLANTSTIPPNTELEVRCDPGYVRIGAPTFCEIQNVYRPDTRRLPQCIKIGGDTLTGNGRHYTGGRFFGASGVTCDNWLRAAHSGTFVGVERGLVLLQGGNHNYCRNVGGEDYSPFCYTRGGQLKEYCYELPGCGGDQGLCSHTPRTDLYEGDCNKLHTSGCQLPNELYFNRTMWYWENCNAMCCRQANCQ